MDQAPGRRPHRNRNRHRDDGHAAGYWLQPHPQQQIGYHSWYGLHSFPSSTYGTVCSPSTEHYAAPVQADGTVMYAPYAFMAAPLNAYGAYMAVPSACCQDPTAYAEELQPVPQVFYAVAGSYPSGPVGPYPAFWAPCPYPAHPAVYGNGQAVFSQHPHFSTLQEHHLNSAAPQQPAQDTQHPAETDYALDDSACASGQESDCTLEAGGWGSMTAGILQPILARIGDAEVKHLRLVCRHWRGVVDNNLETLTPSVLQTRVLVKRFPNLKVLHLTNCANIRNKDLLIISESGLSLHTLTLGDDTNKPWVTNVGLSSIARMPTLTSLNLHDCSGVTNKGLLELTALQGLSSLSLKGCSKLTSGGFEAIQGHTSLTSLNLFGCRISDAGLQALRHLQLVTLHLGNTKVKDEGLGHLAQITTLQELHFDQEDLSDAGVAQLTSLTRLQSLALRDCVDVSADLLSVLIPALPNLISLDLYKNFTMNDSQLARCLEFLGAVTCLDLRCTPVTDDGLQQLTKLSSLQRLCLAPTKECLWSSYLCVVSNLTQLTSLSINNCTLISFGQLETLRQLKLLRELDLSHDSNKEEQRDDVGSQRKSVNPTAIDAMAKITSLTSIDLSRRPVHEQHLSTLAERLPRLHTLIIVGCPIQKAEVQSLKRRFPELIVHHRPQQLDFSCSSSDHSIN